MSAVNGTGYEVQIYDEVCGWVTETAGFSTMAQAQSALSQVTPDGFERRAYESLTLA